MGKKEEKLMNGGIKEREWWGNEKDLMDLYIDDDDSNILFFRIIWFPIQQPSSQYEFFYALKEHLNDIDI